MEDKLREFTYLGSKNTEDGDSGKDVQNRIVKARGAFAALKKIWKAKNISLKLQITFLKATPIGVRLYSVQSWKVTQTICKKLDIFQYKCLREYVEYSGPIQSMRISKREQELHPFPKG